MAKFRTGTTRDIRELDRIAIERYGIPGVILMENAGRGAADVAQDMAVAGGRVLVVCGSGNNGGDGFVIGRHLHNRGFEVEFLVVNPDKIKPGGDADINFEIIKRMSLHVREVGDAPESYRIDSDRYCLVIDALLGTGLSGEVREPARSVINEMNESGLPMLAVDTPSGLNTDTGEMLGVCVHANRTVTFAAAKRGFFAGMGPKVVGELHVADIGVPRELIESLPIKHAQCSKQDR